MTKKRVIRNFCREWKIFPKKRHSEILVREKCFRPPQTRRQVSATELQTSFQNYSQKVTSLM